MSARVDPARSHLLDARTPEEVLAAGRDGDPERARRFALRHLGPFQASVALLPSASHGSRVLDLSGSCGQVSRVHRLRGADADLVDHDEARCHVADVVEAADRVHHLDGPALPFPSRTFDVVHIDVDVWRERHPPGHVLALLDEARRVLRPSGTVVLTYRNPLDPRPFMRRDPSGADDRARGWAADLLRGGWSRQLRRAGFPRTAGLVIWPERYGRHVLGHPRAISAVEEHGLLDDAEVTDSHPILGGLKRRLRTSLTFAPHRCVVGGRTDLRVAGWTGSPRPEKTLITVRFGSVIAFGSGTVRKAALTAGQAEAIEDEVARTRAAAVGPLARCVPREARSDRCEGVPGAVFERADRGCPAHELGPRLAEVLEVEGVHRQLGQTSLRRLLSEDRYWLPAVSVDLDRVRQVMEPLWSRRTLCGPSHGDLWSGNVMVRADGTTLLVDWDRYEDPAPLVVDAVTAWIDERAVTAESDHVEITRRLIGGSLGGPLRCCVDRIRGELSLQEAAFVRLTAWILAHGRKYVDGPGVWVLWPGYEEHLGEQLRITMCALGHRFSW